MPIPYTPYTGPTSGPNFAMLVKAKADNAAAMAAAATVSGRVGVLGADNAADVPVATTNTTLATMIIATTAGQRTVIDGVATFSNLADVTSDLTLQIFVGGVALPSQSLATLAGVTSIVLSTLSLPLVLAAGAHTVALVATNDTGPTNCKVPAHAAVLRSLQFNP